MSSPPTGTEVWAPASALTHIAAVLLNIACDFPHDSFKP